MSAKGSSSILLALFLAFMISATTASLNEDRIKSNSIEQSSSHEELIKSKITETLSNQDLLKDQMHGIAGVPAANAPKIDDAVAGFFKSTSAPPTLPGSEQLHDYEEIYPPKASPPKDSGSSSQVASSVLSLGVVIGLITSLVAL